MQSGNIQINQSGLKRVCVSLDYKIIDNALSEEKFSSLENEILSSTQPWYYSYNVADANNEEDAANTFLNSVTINGFQGPRVSRIFTINGNSAYSLAIVLKRKDLQVVTDNLREIGGSNIIVNKPDYVFDGESNLFTKLMNNITGKK